MLGRWRGAHNCSMSALKAGRETGLCGSATAEGNSAGIELMMTVILHNVFALGFIFISPSTGLSGLQTRSKITTNTVTDPRPA